MPVLSGFFCFTVIDAPIKPRTFAPHIADVVAGACVLKAPRSVFWTMSFGTVFLHPSVDIAPRTTTTNSAFRMSEPPDELRREATRRSHSRISRPFGRRSTLANALDRRAIMTKAPPPHTRAFRLDTIVSFGQAHPVDWAHP